MCLKPNGQTNAWMRNRLLLGGQPWAAPGLVLGRNACRVRHRANLARAVLERSALVKRGAFICHVTQQGGRRETAAVFRSQPVAQLDKGAYPHPMDM